MKLEQQVANLELSKKLKELGVKQESLFWWMKTNNGDEYVLGRVHSRPHNETVSTFTVAELGEMLPVNFHLSMFRTLNGQWGVELDTNEQISYRNDTEADARAQMLIYLLENKLI